MIKRYRLVEFLRGRPHTYEEHPEGRFVYHSDYLAEINRECTYTNMIFNDVYKTSCGHEVRFLNTYCPYCGGRVVEK